MPKTIVDECSGQEFPDHDEQIRAEERKKFLSWLDYNAPECVWQRYHDGYDVRRGKRPEG